MRTASFLIAEKRGEKKMKTKQITAIMTTILLAGMMFYAIPVKAQNYIKIGVIGPEGWPQMDGMREGAELARDWINGPGGGIVIEGTRYDVQLFFANEHAADMRPDLGAAEMSNLITVDNVDFVYGGFRTECTSPIRDKAADLETMFFICGAATNRLIDCGLNPPCGACVRENYEKYKYTFRITPINDTMLFYNILGFLKGYVLPYKLVPLYGSPINTAVIAEDLDWTVNMYNAFVYGGYLAPYAQIVTGACARTPYGTTNFVPYLDTMHAAGIRLVIHIYSSPDSIALISQAAAHPLKAIFGGIDVLGQSTAFWSYTGGGCQHEAFLCTTGTRTPMSTISQPYTTTEVWDLTWANYGHAPTYTSWGVYDGIIALHDTLEGGTLHPPFNQNAGGKNDLLVPIFEATDRNGTVGRFKYTQYHDVFSNEYGANWEQGYVRAVWGQWQSGRIEVVWPADPNPTTPGTEFAKIYSLLDGTGDMYPYPHDVTQDGEVGFVDAMMVRNAFGGKPAAPDKPADPKWFFVADTVADNTIDVFDALYVRGDYGKHVALPLVYCDEAGKLS